MPHANIWIKLANKEVWDSIDKKSDWINNQLASKKVSLSDIASPKPSPKAQEAVKKALVEANLEMVKVGYAASQPDPVKDEIRYAPVLPVSMAEAAKYQGISLLKPKSSKVCKVHGLGLDSRGRCLQKGCKFA